jgi:hypothetical protein
VGPEGAKVWKLDRAAINVLCDRHPVLQVAAPCVYICTYVYLCTHIYIQRESARERTEREREGGREGEKERERERASRRGLLI